MKKLFAAGLSAVMLLSLAACSGTSQSGIGGGSGAAESGQVQETEAPTTVPTVASDTEVKLMTFSAPEGYKTVERFIKTTGGKVEEKDITYKFDDDSKLVYACMEGMTLSDEIPVDKTTPAEYGGESYNVYESGSSKTAFAQKGDDAYAVSYVFAKGIDEDKFASVMADVKFDGSGEFSDNSKVELDDIRYTLDSTRNIYSTTSNLAETPEGEVTEKKLSWSFGQDKDNEDFSFSVTEFLNTTVEEKQNKDKKYEQKQINGIDYTVRVADSGSKPVEYFVQHGNNVYRVWNNGKSGLLTTRNEECEAAFEAFVNSISFK